MGHDHDPTINRLLMFFCLFWLVLLDWPEVTHYINYIISISYESHHMIYSSKTWLRICVCVAHFMSEQTNKQANKQTNAKQLNKLNNRTRNLRAARRRLRTCMVVFSDLFVFVCLLFICFVCVVVVLIYLCMQLFLSASHQCSSSPAHGGQ